MTEQEWLECTDPQAMLEFLRGKASVCWYCPLLKREIPDGLCLDINYQRLRFFKPDVLEDAQRETGMTVEEISSICEACPNLPFREE